MSGAVMEQSKFCSPILSGCQMYYEGYLNICCGCMHKGLLLLLLLLLRTNVIATL